MARILIVDDEAAICWSLDRLFRSEKFDVSIASSAEQALAEAQSRPPDIILLDVRLPCMSGLDAIAQFRKLNGDVPIVLMTAFCNLETAIAAFDKQVSEYLPKPFDLDLALTVVQRLLATPKSGLAIDPIVSLGNSRFPQATLVGKSNCMQEVYRRIALAASSSIPVLITGENGTGKELVAQAIHANSARKHLPMYAVALPALSESLLESELFGHVKGAFTGAIGNREGLFSAANDSTILLDEIGELPLSQQVKLLRVLESGEYTPLGTTITQRSNARVLAATNRNLREMVRAGTFREDLYFRLAVFDVALPSLRERREDIAELCIHLLERLGRASAETAITADVIAILSKRPWPGNVRELRNTIEHAHLMSRGERIHASHLQSSFAEIRNDQGEVTMQQSVLRWIEGELLSMDENDEGLYEKFLALVEPVLFEATLKSTKGSIAGASQRLGLHRGTLRERLKRHSIEP